MHNLITLLIFLFAFKPSFALGEVTPMGGWAPIPDVTDHIVVDIGKFAVTQHNKENHVSLKFRKIVKGERQVVAGMNYNLTITATDANAENDYVALVWDVPWEKFRQLVSFKGTD